MSRRLPLTKPIARRARLRGVEYVVELAPDGVTFRQIRRRFKVTAPLELVLSLAERVAGDELRRMRAAAYRSRRRS